MSEYPQWVRMDIGCCGRCAGWTVDGVIKAMKTCTKWQRLIHALDDDINGNVNPTDVFVECSETWSAMVQALCSQNPGLDYGKVDGAIREAVPCNFIGRPVDKPRRRQVK